MCPSYLNGRFGQGDMVQHWSEKYNEVCNAMDMVGFEEQVKFLPQGHITSSHSSITLLSAYKYSHLALSGKGGHDDYPGRDSVSGKYHVRADWAWRIESERDVKGLAQSHRGELAQMHQYLISKDQTVKRPWCHHLDVDYFQHSEVFSSNIYDNNSQTITAFYLIIKNVTS